MRSLACIGCLVLALGCGARSGLGLPTDDEGSGGASATAVTTGEGAGPTVHACTPGDAPVALTEDAWFTYDALQVDGQHVYYTREDGVARVPKTGGASELVVPRVSASFIASFAMDRERVYATNISAATDLVAVSKADLSTAIIVPSFACDTLRQANDHLFAARGMGDEDVTISWLRTDGSELETLAEHLPNDATGFRTDGASLFYGRQTTGDIVRDPIAKEPTTVLVADTNAFLDVDAGYVYLTHGGGLERVPATGGDVESIDPDHYPIDVAFDDTSAYVSAASFEIVRVPKAGGAATSLYATAQSPYTLAVDDDCVYWLEITATPYGRIMRAPK